MSTYPPFISVVVPWNSTESLLYRALESLHMQSYPHFEIIVVASGSAVERLMQVASDAALSECRFLISSKADISAARNVGIQAATGDWIAFLDVEDRFVRHKLERLAEVIQSNVADLLFSRGIRVLDMQTRTYYPRQLLQTNEDPGEYFFSRGANFSASAFAVRADFAKSLGFKENLKRFEAMDFVLRAHTAGTRIRMLAEPLYEWWDESEQDGPPSGRKDTEAMNAWAEAARPTLSDKAFYAFKARHVAPNEYPRHFLSGIKTFYQGWRRGGVSLKETMMFVIRGFLPKRSVKWLLTQRAKRDGEFVAASLLYSNSFNP